VLFLLNEEIEGGVGEERWAYLLEPREEREAELLVLEGAELLARLVGAGFVVGVGGVFGEEGGGPLQKVRVGQAVDEAPDLAAVIAGREAVERQLVERLAHLAVVHVLRLHTHRGWRESRSRRKMGYCRHVTGRSR
jgi:hypothetical protein